MAYTPVIGKTTLYHCTLRSTWEDCIMEGGFIKGKKGKLGAAVYLSSTPEGARKTCKARGDLVVIEVVSRLVH